MNNPAVTVNYDHLPFYITAPGESDVLFTAVTISLVAILVGFGALYFTIQAIPDKIVKGTSKTQMQIVGLLGLISLFTMNNLYWVIAILLAAVRIPDFMAPLTDIARSLRARAGDEATGTEDSSAATAEPTEGDQSSSVDSEDAGNREETDND